MSEVVRTTTLRPGPEALAPRGRRGSAPGEAACGAPRPASAGPVPRACSSPSPSSRAPGCGLWGRPSRATFQSIAGRLEKHRAKLKEEIGGWKRRIRESSREAVVRRVPTLLSVEPLTCARSDGGEARVAYRAQLRLASDDHEHAWQTEPFGLDDLLAVVVSTRVANVAKWCTSRHARSHDLPWLRSCVLCALRTAAFWALALLLTWRLAAALRPWIRLLALGNVWGSDLEPQSMDVGVAEWAAALVTAAVLLSTTAGLLAGVTEMSFLPAKAILQLERKDETAQVCEQLQLLLKSNDCLQRLEVCNFLNLGMATYYNSSETQKEGRCFYRRHESSDIYFTRARRRRWSFLCCTFDCRCRLRAGRERSMTERWLVLRKDGLALFSSIMDKDPTDMLFFDTSFSLFRDDEDRVLVCGASWLLELDFGHGPADARQGSVQSWCNAITLTAQLSPRTREQRFGSFAPIRHPAQAKQGDRHLLRRSLAKFLIGGRATFRRVAQSIMIAEHEIFILGFWVTPHLPLVREGEALPGGADPHLASLLRSAADRGVRVFVLLFHETPLLVPNDSEYAEAELRHPNIFVVRHRSRWDINRLWTHHEKVVVVDQQLAILGGIDLCLGRYDDSRHRLRDWPARVWEGQDYSNPRTKDFVDVRSNGDTLDRRQQPRMPWQDIQCMLLGRPARDVARHCIERWNHAKSMRPQYQNFPTALLRRKVAVCNDKMLAVPAQKELDHWPPEANNWQECTVQIVRSVGRWSAGTRMESSTHTAYCDLLQDAERFVYIENQFFVSGMDGDEAIGNRVAEALYRRVVRAHTHKEAFHVMIVLPLLPALDGAIAANASSPLLYVMHWQYRTLRTLRSRLREAGAQPEDFLSVYGLRKHSSLNGENMVTEQIYVHSKVMVVDDRVAVIGSANINDRSLLGMRDSEVNVILRDTETSEALLGGPRQAGSFASGFRKALFAQHLGWGAEELEGRYADPLSRESLQEVRRVARRNTEIYEATFGALPSDSIRSWSELASRRGGSLPVGDTTRSPSAAEATALAEVQGHLVEFPMDFLVEEDLAPPTFSVGGLTPDCFT